jgi:type II secretory pathway pseudopilin PulG
MSKPPEANPAAAKAADPLQEAESSIGHALAVIHRLLPRLDDAARVKEVQAAFQKAAACLETARAAHQKAVETRTIALSGAGAGGLAGETVAAISAAIAVVLGTSFRLLSVQKVPAPVPHLNVWALEGRTQIFQSHKIR